MGLAEKRALKEFQDKHFKTLCEEIKAATGFEIPVTVQWDSLAEEGYSHLYEDAFTKVYFKPLIDGFRELCVDEMGKEAVQTLVKKIVICNTNNYSNPNGITLSNGTLTVDHKPTTNIDDVKDRIKGIVQVIEKAA